MFERFTDSARTVVVDAQHQARRLGHRQIGTPHLLLALLAEDDGLLAGHGVSAEAVETALRRALEQPAPSRPSRVDDAEMLASLGIDVHRIREAVEASFGPGALDRALGSDRDAPGGRRGPLSRLTRRRRGRPAARDERRTLASPSGAARRRARPGTHLAFSPDARKTLELSLREALRLGDRSIDSDHVLLGLLRCDDGLAAGLLAGLGVPPGDLRAAVERRRRRSA